MKVNTRKRINSYIQGQQFVARVFLILWLLASSNLESALATSESTGDSRAPLLGQLAKGPGRYVIQNAQDNLPTTDDKTRQLLHQAAKDQDPTLRQASVSTLAYLATADDRTRKLLDQAAQEQDEDVRDIALAALKILEPTPSTSHTDKKQVLQKFFKQAVATNDVPRLTKLILENTDEVGELCESLAENLLTATLPQTADTLLIWGVEHKKYELVKFIINHGRQHIMRTLPRIADTLLIWGVKHNKYELVEFIIKYGRKYITNNDRKGCLGQTVTELAAQKGDQKLFLLLINNAVDVDIHNMTAFMSVIICKEYELAHAMLDLGEYRLEHPDKNGYTPQDHLDSNQEVLEERKQQKEALKVLLHQKIQTMNERNLREKQQALLKKEQ